jgi:hypothetical protein
VQVQHVELVHGEQVDEAPHVGRGQEVAGDVEQAAPPTEARLVRDAGRRHPPRPRVAVRMAVHRGRQQLAQGLRAVEHAGRGAAGDTDAVGAHVEPVRLGRQGFVARQRDPARPRRQPAAGGGTEPAAQPTGDADQLGVGRQRGRRVDREHAVVDPHRQRAWYHRHPPALETELAD